MATIETSEYLKVLKDFKIKIKDAQLRAAKAVNIELLSLYWYLGANISELEANSKWGASFIKRLSKDLTNEFEGVEGFSETNLKYIRRWFQFYCPILGNQPFEGVFLEAKNLGYPIDNKQLIIGPQAGAQLTALDLTLISWSHHKVLLDKIKEPALIAFYIRQSVENGWSRNSLQLHIESKLHTRYGTSINNFSRTLPAHESDLARESIRNPYTLNFLNLNPSFKEKDLEKALIKQLSEFLLELGKGFAYVGNQIQLNIAGSSYFPDLIFFNTKLKRYFIFELKVTQFEPAFVGQLQFYCRAFDDKFKEPEFEPTIGIIICKIENKMVVEYALSASNSAIAVSELNLETFLDEFDDDGLNKNPDLEIESGLASEPQIQYGKKYSFFPIRVI